MTEDPVLRMEWVSQLALRTRIQKSLDEVGHLTSNARSTPHGTLLKAQEELLTYSQDVQRIIAGLMRIEASGLAPPVQVRAYLCAYNKLQSSLQTAKASLKSPDGPRPTAISERRDSLHRPSLDVKRPASPASHSVPKRARRNAILRLHLDALAYGLRSPSSDSDAESPVERQWARELTREGVEPNPGPQVTTTPLMPLRSTGRNAPLPMQLLSSQRMRCHSFPLPTLPETHLDVTSNHSALGKAPKGNATPTVEWCQFPKAGGWVRDLTAEGVEPNPGPSSLAPDASASEGMLLDTDGPGSQLDALCDFQEAAKAWVCNPNEPFRPILRQLRDGRWHENIPLASPEIVSCVSAAQNQGIDILFPGDGLPNSRMPATTCIYHLFNQNQIQADALAGRHTLLFFPKALPFADQTPVFSFHSWCTLVKSALSLRSSTPTKVSMVFPARHNSPMPTLIPLLDRRYDLDVLRFFLLSTVVLPDIPWDFRSEEGHIEHCRNHRTMPLLLFSFSNEPGRIPPSPPRVHWHTIPDQISELAGLTPDTHAVHVVLNCHLALAIPDESGYTLSAIRILMVLNRFDPTETTSNFRNASLLRYPPDPMPMVQRHAPDGVVIAHYHIPPSLLQHLEEDRPLLQENGIEWVAFGESQEGLYLVNHLPRKRVDGKKSYKAQALEVRDGILTSPSIAQLLEFVLIWNRWDVLVRPKEGVNVTILSSALQNLDNYAIIDACRNARVNPPRNVETVSDPQILVFFPLHLLPTYLLSVVAAISPVQTHQDLGRPGSLLITFQIPGIARLLYGMRLGTSSGPISFSCGDGSQDTIHEREAGLPPLAPLSARKEKFPATSVSAVLSSANLLAAGTSPDLGNGMPGEASPRTL